MVDPWFCTCTFTLKINTWFVFFYRTMPSPSSSKSRSLFFFIFTIRISSFIFLFFFSIFIIYLSMMNLMNFVLLKQNLFIICHDCIALFWGLMCSSKQNKTKKQKQNKTENVVSAMSPNVWKKYIFKKHILRLIW